MRTLIKLCALSATILALCGFSPVLAAPLGTGVTLYPAPGELEPLPGVVVADSGPVAFAAATFAGTLQSVVLSGDATNALGGLTFLYSVRNDAVSINDIGRLTVVDFTGWLVDASYQVGLPSPPLIPAGGLAPTMISRATPDVIGFDFYGDPVGPGTLKPGLQSPWLVVQTNAPAFVVKNASVIDGSVVMVPSFGPVPEPATLCLLGVGMGFLARRRAS